MSVNEEKLKEIIKRHEHKLGVTAAEAQNQIDKATKVFGAEAALSIAARAGDLDYEGNTSPISAWDRAVSEHIVKNRIRQPIMTDCENCGEPCLWCWWTGATPLCGCVEAAEKEDAQAEFEAEHGGAVTEEEAKWNAMSDYEKAYAMFEEGWTIPPVAEQVGITYEQAERISYRQLHDRAVERHDPAKCPWCRERMA